MASEFSRSVSVGGVELRFTVPVLQMAPPARCQSGLPGRPAASPAARACAPGRGTWSNSQKMAQCARCPPKRQKSARSMKSAVSGGAGRVGQVEEEGWSRGLRSDSKGLWSPTLSSQQLSDDRVGRVGRVQRHLRDGHEEAPPNDQNEPSWWLYVQSGDIPGGEVHDARVPWVGERLDTRGFSKNLLPIFLGRGETWSEPCQEQLRGPGYQCISSLREWPYPRNTLNNARNDGELVASE